MIRQKQIELAQLHAAVEEKRESVAMVEEYEAQKRKLQIWVTVVDGLVQH